MRIAILTPFKNNYGGGEVFIEGIKKYADANDPENTIIVFSSDEKAFEAIHVNIPTINTYGKLFRWLIAVCRLIKSYDIDCLILNDIFLAQFSLLFRPWFNQVISLVHGEIDYNNCVNQHLRKIITRIRLKLIISGSNKILSVNKKNKQLYNGNKKVFVIGNYIQNNKSSIQVRTKPEGKYLFCGRLVKLKNIEKMLRVMEIIVNDYYSNAMLTIVGDGPEKNWIEQYIIIHNINGHVKLLGYVDHDKISDVYNQSDCLLLFSETEGFPTVILEALQSGVPCVVSNVGSNEDIIHNGNNGYIFDLDVSDKEIAKLSWNALKINRQNCIESIKRYNIDNFYEKFIKLVSK